LKAQEGLFGRPFSGFARFSPRRALRLRPNTCLPVHPSSLGRLLCCHARHDARPLVNGVKALTASATGGLGRFFAALRVSGTGHFFNVPGRLQPDAVGGLDRYLLPCASWPYAKALGASTYTLRTL